MSTATLPHKLNQPINSSQKGFHCKTILFNCNCHSFDEVENQLIKAIRCSLARAREISWQVHNQGCSVVYSGHRERCEAVSSVLEDIGLLTQVSE